MTRDTLDRGQRRADPEPTTAQDDQAGQAAPVAMLQTMLARGGQRNPEQLAAVLRAHPYACRELMTLLNTAVGMRFAQFVMRLAQEPQAATGGEAASPHTHQADQSDETAVSRRATGRPQAQLAFNSTGVLQSQTQASDVERTEYIYDTAQTTGKGILDSLVPGYLAARDQCDAVAVAELGGRLVGALGIVHGAKAALDQMLQQMLRALPQHSVQGGTPEEDLALVITLQAVEAKAPLLVPLVQTVDAMVATTMTPHVFRGREVAGQAVVVALDGPPMQGTEKLTGELQRTVGMLVLVDDLKTQLLAGKQGLDQASLQAARSKLMPWASRPLDFAFLRAALGPMWELLDATATGPIEAKPSDVLASATTQAKHTGWLGDVGQVDINNAFMELRIGRRENVEFVIRQLYTADPDTRARLLIQVKERGLLDALCSAVGWADVKELHDSLGSGFSEIKTDLQRYFIDKRGYGPGVGHEWEHHDSSLHGMVAGLGGAGKVLNFALDVGTFGFNSSYGKALDDRSEGRTSEAEVSRAKMHAAGRTAAIAAISILTGGLADKAVRGGAATVSTMRGIGVGAAGGSAGGVSALGTSDAYGNYVSGDQQGFSSPEEYVKAALLGGTIGGAIGAVTQGLSNRAAAKYLSRANDLPAPVEEHPLTKIGKEEPSAHADDAKPSAPVEEHPLTKTGKEKRSEHADDAKPSAPSAGPKKNGEEAILGRSFRPPNPSHMPNAVATEAMSRLRYDAYTDCSELARRLHDAVGSGSILRAEPAIRGTLRVLENGTIDGDMFYHEAYTDGAYVFDIRMSSTPIPKSDWIKAMTNLNPGVIIR